MESVDYSRSNYYYPFIVSFFVILAFLEMIIKFFGKQEGHDYYHLDEDEKILVKDKIFIKKGKDLQTTYMIAYLLTRASMWAKTPYNYMLFSTVYNFTIVQIGYLYILDAIVGLLVGPFLGIIADRFGRKLIACFYPINNMISTTMRISGIVPLAFVGQIFTGVSGGILATAYESWLNYEINSLYKDNKNYIQHYKKHIFATVSFYDTLTSMCVILISAVIYVIEIS